MADPTQSSHWSLRRWCLQIADPPQSLHVLLIRWCSQMADPPQSLQSYFRRWCSQMLDPPQALQLLLMRWCSHIADPPISDARPAAVLARAPDALVLAEGRSLGNASFPAGTRRASSSSLRPALHPLRPSPFTPASAFRWRLRAGCSGGNDRAYSAVSALEFVKLQARCVACRAVDGD